MMVASVPRATSSLIFGEHEQRHSRKHPWTGPPRVRASKSDKTERETEREGNRERAKGAKPCISFGTLCTLWHKFTRTETP
jgi:hypothetical protein